MLPKKLAEHDIVHIDNLPVTYFMLEKSAPTCVFPELPQLGSIQAMMEEALLAIRDLQGDLKS